MQIPVLIELIAESRFRAKSGEPLPLSAEGATQDEALQKLRDLIDGQLQNGTRLMTLEVPGQENPWGASWTGR